MRIMSASDSGRKLFRLTNNMHMIWTHFNHAVQGPVVQSIVSLTASLIRHFVKFMPTTLSNPLLFFVEKM